MLNRLQKNWNVSNRQLVVILCVFAITGTLTAYISRSIPDWAGFDEHTFWLWKLLLRLAVLIFGYQILILIVAFLLGQFPFFWQYEKKILVRLGFMKNENRNIKLEAEKKSEPQTANNKHSVAIFASGAGSNALKMIEYFTSNPALHPDETEVKVALIVCNKPEAGVLNIAAAYGIPTLLLEKERFFRGDAYLPVLRKHSIDFIVLAGFLWKIPETLIDAYPRRIVNIHPALLPKYGGKGMYGARVHEAVLAAGEKESGITIHYVDEHYDNGAIIFQARCDVKQEDTPETLAQRIHGLEHRYYPEVVERILRT